MKDAEQQEEIASGDQAEGSIEGAEEPKAVPESTGETGEVSESPESSEK